jgi:hypothetical protein
MEWRWRVSDESGQGQMKGHGTKFGRKKEEAIAALLTQRTTEDAARAIGVARHLKIPISQEGLDLGPFSPSLCSVLTGVALP